LRKTRGGKSLPVLILPADAGLVLAIVFD